MRLLVLDERLGLAPVAVDLGGRRDEDALAERLQWSSTVSVPWMFVTSVRTGSSTISRTPTAAARWKTTSQRCTSSFTTDDLSTESTIEVEVAALAQVGDVALRPGREVVEDEDLPAVGEQALREMRADEARAAGDQGALLRGAHRARS